MLDARHENKLVVTWSRLDVLEVSSQSARRCELIRYEQGDDVACPFIFCDVCEHSIEHAELGMVSWDDGGRAVFLHKRCGQLVTPWEELTLFLDQLCFNAGHVTNNAHTRTISKPRVFAQQAGGAL